MKKKSQQIFMKNVDEKHVSDQLLFAWSKNNITNESIIHQVINATSYVIANEWEIFSPQKRFGLVLGLSPIPFHRSLFRGY